ncbi:MAG: hypothetical protein ACO3UU_13760, partial [Minisyncoccia bacterium]
GAEGSVVSSMKAKLEAMAKFKGLTIAVNVPIDLNVFNKRFGIDHQFTTINTIEFAKLHGGVTRKLVRGDSHSLSVWKPGFGLDRTDGKTLHGFLKDADSLVEEWNQKYDEVILYFGNIDLRFHLMRQEKPFSSTVDLFNRYVEFARKLNNATLVNLLPVEHESRNYLVQDYILNNLSLEVEKKEWNYGKPQIKL